MRNIPLGRLIAPRVVAILSALFLPTMHAVTPINPEPGQSIWTLVSDMGIMLDKTAPCKPTSISNASALGGIITISSPGYYCVVENLTNRVVIASDDVVLTLKNHKIEPAISGVNLITVNGGYNNIIVRNGTLSNASSPQNGHGVIVENNVSHVHLSNIKTINCETGVLLNGTNGGTITACKISGCDFVSNRSGIILDHANQTVVQDCCVTGSTQTGFEVRTGKANCFVRCCAIKTAGNATVVGFKARDGSSNLFQKCVSKGTKTSAWEFYNKAYGFLLTGTEQKTKIIECIVNETGATSKGSAMAYGVHLNPVLMNYDDLLTEIDSAPSEKNINSVAWSPDSRYIAIAEDVNSASSIKVFLLHNNKLKETTSASVSRPREVVWSPCGNFLAVVDLAATELYKSNLQLFRFDGSQLTLLPPKISFGNNSATCVAWSPNGKYVVVGDMSGYISVFNFDGSQLAFLEKVSMGLWVNSIDWSPDGKHIVAGSSNEGNNILAVYEFTGSKLNPIFENNQPDGFIRKVRWSPVGQFIAACDETYTRIYNFDGTSLTFSGIQDSRTSTVQSLAWAPNGKFLAIICKNSETTLFDFDGLALTYIKSQNLFGNQIKSHNLLFNVGYTIDWSSCGRFIATGGTTNKLQAFTAMYGPWHCLVKDCVICDTAAHGEFVGTGIGMGGCNYALRNKCCNNETNFSYGVPNLFYGDHNEQEPFDNISIPILS